MSWSSIPASSTSSRSPARSRNSAAGPAVHGCRWSGRSRRAGAGSRCRRRSTASRADGSAAPPTTPVNPAGRRRSGRPSTSGSPPPTPGPAGEHVPGGGQNRGLPDPGRALDQHQPMRRRPTAATASRCPASKPSGRRGPRPGRVAGSRPVVRAAIRASGRPPPAGLRGGEGPDVFRHPGPGISGTHARDGAGGDVLGDLDPHRRVGHQPGAGQRLLHLAADVGRRSTPTGARPAGTARCRRGRRGPGSPARTAPNPTVPAVGPVAEIVQFGEPALCSASGGDGGDLVRAVLRPRRRVPRPQQRGAGLLARDARPATPPRSGRGCGRPGRRGR